VHVPTGTLSVVVPPADATVTSVNVNVPVAVRKPDALQRISSPPTAASRPEATAGISEATRPASTIVRTADELVRPSIGTILTPAPVGLERLSIEVRCT
jgi:hypothetical protein